MKKTLLTALIVCSVSAIFAQNSKVVAAYNHMRYNELDKAKEAIDAAAVHEKSIDNPKTWLYRAQVYTTIYTTEEWNQLAENPLAEALDAYNNLEKYDTKGRYADELNQGKGFIIAKIFEEGVNNFNEQNYEAAIANFGVILEGNPEDTIALYNSALAAERSGDDELTRKFYGKLIEMDYDQPEMYRSLGNNYLLSGDTAKGLEVIEMGRARYPEYNGLVIDELNIYIAQNRLDVAIGKLEEAIKVDPENKTLYFALGAAADNIGEFEKASNAYKKAIEIDPEYFAANYNLGAMYYNKGVNIVQEANKLPISKTKEYEAAKTRFIAEFNKALPYLEKALEIEPNDRNTLISLKEVYVRLGDLEKSKEMKIRLDELGG